MFSRGICWLHSWEVRAAGYLTLLIMSAELAWKRALEKVQLRSSLGVNNIRHGLQLRWPAWWQLRLLHRQEIWRNQAWREEKVLWEKARTLGLFAVSESGSLGFRLFCLHALNLDMHRFAQESKCFLIRRLESISLIRRAWIGVSPLWTRPGR